MRRLALVAVLALASVARAEDETYRLPPKEVQDLVLAPPTPRVGLDPTRRLLLLQDRPPLSPIADLARPEARLAGLRLDPRTNGPSREAYATGLSLLSLEPGATPARIEGLPESARIRDVTWAPDGSRFAFSITTEDSVELWLATTKDLRAKRVPGLTLSDAHGAAFVWLGSGALVARAIPKDRGPAPSEPTVPSGPVVRESQGGRKAAARTYQNLLRDAHDDALFEHFLDSELVRVDAATGALAPLGPRGLIERASPSPDGRWLLVETIHRPFSRLVPVGRFPNTIEVLDLEGKEKPRVLAELPLAEDVSIAFDAVRKGPRSWFWRADAPATLVFVEARDDGDPRAAAEHRDALLALAAPFDGKPVELARLAWRFAGVHWSSGDLALVTERWWKTRRTRTWIVRPDDPSAAPRLLFDRSSEDRYSDPGEPLLERTASGHAVLLRAGTKLFFTGEGASPDGSHPFLDRRDAMTLEVERLFRSETDGLYERPLALLDAGAGRVLVSRESPRDPPNWFVRELGKKDEPRRVTSFPHPTPALADVKKELIRYTRQDGVALTAKLYVPPGWTPEKGRLPLLMWAYPGEFKSAEAASQVTDSPFRFVRISPSSPLILLARGYAVLEDPKMPIVGEGERQPNDTYVEQLVASARAAVEAVVERGVADRDRIAIAGHSYGAFTTANLLAHSDLFRAGIARSGAYNRTLTPFGFQGEERSFWEAPEVYGRMSPFNVAPKIDEPLLLIHGAADDNPGTFTLQSERLFAALKGHGKVARLVLLPHESHGYQARESILHVWAETLDWLDRHVKQAGPR